MKNIVKILLLGCFVSLFSACEREESLTASAAQEFYQLPQGNAAFDSEFLAFYEAYGTYILYNFTDNDFRWNGTTRLLYMAKNADEMYISSAYAFLRKAFLDDYEAEKLQQLLPYKILLSAGVHQLTVNAAQPTGYDTVATNLGVYTGVNHVTFGFANSSLESFSVTQKRDLQANVQKAFYTYALNRGKVTIPAAFTALFDVTGNSTTAYKGLGFLEYQRSYTVSLDFLMYVYAALRYNEEEFASLYLTSSFDTSGKVAKKFAIVKAYLEDEWGIQTEVIANRAW
ncbi:hypothetical protein [Sphingobacterium sp. LRF_L2]|uniref:hypothetical protein n=1 Tax=Sphingobacterium sp. LRF_L2 TaxID=3369421 RepID=UPI003F5D6B0A